MPFRNEEPDKVVYPSCYNLLKKIYLFYQNHPKQYAYQKNGSQEARRPGRP
jgi:hypothetical protein